VVLRVNPTGLLRQKLITFSESNVQGNEISRNNDPPGVMPAINLESSLSREIDLGFIHSVLRDSSALTRASALSQPCSQILSATTVVPTNHQSFYRAVQRRLPFLPAYHHPQQHFQVQRETGVGVSGPTLVLREASAE
jgi:hypothetical protein